MSTNQSPLFICYGSATGNAEHIAKDLAATYETLLGNPDADTFFPSVVCCELDHYKKKCQAVWEIQPESGVQRKHGVLIVTSTTGNGDAPENASRFTRYIKRKTTIDSQPFKHVAYAVLGLGDTNYDQFCNTGKVVDKKMTECGATRVTPLVCADEATGLEDAVDPWTASILAKITVACREEPTDSTFVMTTVTATQKTVLAQEEKKMEPTEETKAKHDFAVTPPPSTTSAKGVKLVRTLLQEDPISAVDMDKVPPSDTLPTVGAPRISSVVLLDEECGTSSSANDETKLVESTDDEDDGFFYTYNRPYTAPVQAARYLTQTIAASLRKSDDSSPTAATRALREHFNLQGEGADRNNKRVVEITMKLPEQGFSYQPGDAIGMVVENNTEDATWLLNLLEQHHRLKATRLVSLDDNEPLTIKQVILQQVDLTWGALHHHGNKRVLFALSQQAMGDEKRVLEWLSSSYGEKIFQTYIVEQRRSVIDLMMDFPSLQSMSLRTIVGILPSLAPRYYSITSSPMVAKDSLTIALAVVDYLTPSLILAGQENGFRRIGGLASQYLESLAAPLLSSTATQSIATLRIFPKPTEDFRLPTSLETPLILIGPGTGVAPFVGFLEHRQALAKNSASTPGSADLYFGCRHPDHDFLYQTDLEALRENGVLTQLYTAFSREGVKKVYVQHVMEEHADGVRDLVLRQGSAVYICGDGNHMAKSVQTTLQSILQKELGDTAAADYLVNMKKEHRLSLDIWS